MNDYLMEKQNNDFNMGGLAWRQVIKLGRMHGWISQGFKPGREWNERTQSWTEVPCSDAERHEYALGCMNTMMKEDIANLCDAVECGLEDVPKHVTTPTGDANHLPKSPLQYFAGQKGREALRSFIRFLRDSNSDMVLA
jgi:hypothetical protein